MNNRGCRYLRRNTKARSGIGVMPGESKQRESGRGAAAAWEGSKRWVDEFCAGDSIVQETSVKEARAATRRQKHPGVRDAAWFLEHKMKGPSISGANTTTR